MDTVLDVFVDTAIAKPFSIQVGLWDTVLTMKQKIEKSQGIPVSKQVLFFGSKVLYDHLDIMQCKIFNNSRLLLGISPDYNPNQNNNPVMVNDQVLPQTETPLRTAESVEEFLMNDSPETMEGKDHQLLHQTEQSLAVTIYTQDQLLSDISKIQTKENIQDQYPTTTDPTKQSPSNTTEEIKDDHQHSTKTDQKDQSSLSNSGFSIQDSPVKVTSNSKKRKTLQIDVLQFQKSTKYPIPVFSDDKVGVLRKRLANKNQLGVFALPEGEYFFINKQDVLIDDQTFEENRVARFDTLEIIGRKVTYEGSIPPNTRMSR